MKLAPFFAAALVVVGLVVSAPIYDNKGNVIIRPKHFEDAFAIYTSEHDIVRIVSATIDLNENELNKVDTYLPDPDIVLFFVEADINDNGEKEYKGLYIFNNGKATKLLEQGTDVAATDDKTKVAYFGAKDGVYVYNPNENKAEKYSSVTDSIASIAKESGTDAIYILTEDHDLYKITENGNKKVKIENVKNAEQIMLDHSNNLYYYGPDKQLFVVCPYGVNRASGLPENPTNVKLLNPSVLVDNAVLFLADEELYLIDSSGISTKSGLELHVKLTAFSIEQDILSFFGYNKKIYKFDGFLLLLNVFIHELKVELRNANLNWNAFRPRLQKTLASYSVFRD